MSNSFEKNLRQAAGSAFIAGTALMAAPAGAVDLSGSSGLAETAGQSGLPQNTDVAGIVGSLISSLISLMGIIFLVLVIYAGFVWMTAQGNEEKIKKAKNLITGAVIGLIITFAAYAITSFVIGALSRAV